MYSMYLLIDSRELQLPVMPQKIEVSSSGKNSKTTVLELGEILILHKKGLRVISWESHFPLNAAPYVSGNNVNPIESVKAIQSARESQNSIRFLLLGTDLDINMAVGVESFDYSELGGEPGDIYYKIKLCEYKDYSPKRIVLASAAGSDSVYSVIKEPARVGQSPISSQKTYTVVRGDCLWSIAQKFYGSGNRYPEIYAANQSLIDARNRGTGLSKYTIYAGQVFKIP